MTTITVTTANVGTIQGTVNALQPGDTLIFSDGTYTFTGGLTIGCNGTPNNPITILGLNYSGDPAYWQGGKAIIQCTSNSGTTAMRITGSYLFIGRFATATATNGISVEGGSHIRLWNIRATKLNQGVGFRIWKNSHHVFLHKCFAGFKNADNIVTQRLTKSFVLGTDSASWAGVPDLTNNVQFDWCEAYIPYGWGYQIYEGVRNVQLNASGGDYGNAPLNTDGTPNYTGTPQGTNGHPNAGNATGDGAFISFGTNVRNAYPYAWDPSQNCYIYRKKTVSGIVYGTEQMQMGGLQVSPSAYSITSNDGNFRLYGRLYMEVPDGRTTEYFVIGEEEGVHWFTKYWDPMEFPFLSIGSPAKSYTANPLPYGTTRLFAEFFGSTYTTALTNDAYHMTWGNEIEFLEPCQIIGVAYWRQVASSYDPDDFIMFNMETWGAVTGATVLPHPVINDGDPLSYFTDNALAQNRDASALCVMPETARVLTGHWSHTLTNNWAYNYFATPVDINIPLANYLVCLHWNNVGKTAAGIYTEGLANVAYATTIAIYAANNFGYQFGVWDVGPADMLGWQQYPMNLPRQTRNFGVGFLKDYPIYGTRGPGQSTNSGYYDSTLTVGPIDGRAYNKIAQPWQSLSGQDFFYVDPIVRYGRLHSTTRTVAPGDDLQAVLDTTIPGDVIIIQGTHVGDFVVRNPGTADEPVVIKGDGTAVLQAPFGETATLTAMRCVTNYQYFYNIEFSHAGRGLLIENGVTGIRVENCQAKFTRDEGFIVQESTSDVYIKNCQTTDTGLGGYYGAGIRVGRPGGYWGAIDTPDRCTAVVIEGCTVVRNFGNGIEVHDGCTDIVVTGCTVNYTTPGGNVPPAGHPWGAAGFWSRADGIQLVGCVVTGAPAAGFHIFDSLWSNLIYGRGQEIKGGSSANSGDAAVVSQSDDLKVYADFTATGPNGLARSVENWVIATGTNVAVANFRPRNTSPLAMIYPPAT